jgi:hypothetical protein
MIAIFQKYGSQDLYLMELRSSLDLIYSSFAHLMSMAGKRGMGFEIVAIYANRHNRQSSVLKAL